MRISDWSSDVCSSDLTSCFMLLFVVVSVSFLWMHLAVRQMERNAAGEKLTDLPQFAELEGIHDAAKHGRGTGAAISDWRPEDPDFWARTGNRIAQRNLWISIPCLLLAFAVWMVWRDRKRKRLNSSQ